MDLAGAITAEDDRLFAHPRHKVVAGIGDLAFVPDEQPRAGENAFLLLRVNVLVDKDLAADQARSQGHEAGMITAHVVHRHRFASAQKKNVRFLVSNTFWSRMIFRRAISQFSPLRRSVSSRLPTSRSVSVSTRLR